MKVSFELMPLHKNYKCIYYKRIPSQQSALLAQLLPDDEKSLRQLLLPQVRDPLQCESRSQSPPPTLHWFEFEQQLQPVVGTPLHCVGEGGAVVGVPPPITLHIILRIKDDIFTFKIIEITMINQ